MKKVKKRGPGGSLPGTRTGPRKGMGTVTSVAAQKLRKRRQDKQLRMSEKSLDASDLEVSFKQMPACKNPKRREACSQDLELHLRTYNPEIFWRPFSVAHQQFISKLQSAIFETSWLVESVFRGFGKTAICLRTAEWAILNGHRRFIPLFAATHRHAGSMIEALRTGFETNELLYQDYPEVVHPIRALEGRFQRSLTQIFRGNKTYLGWRGNQLVFPSNTYAKGCENKCEGSAIVTFGWSAAFRGITHTTPKGELLRPDFALVDDPQDEEMASNPDSCKAFLDVLVNVILGLGGHDRQISVVVPATIIRPGDAIDQLTDATQYPAWIAENVPMLQTEPADMKLWLGEYSRIRNDFSRKKKGDQARARKESGEFYQRNSLAMAGGAEATWAECFQHDEVDAIQHAMNLWIDKGEDYYKAECQGRPNERSGSCALVLDPDYITKKISGLGRRNVSANHLYLSGFIDVGHNKLQWMICSWGADFSGSIIDYGEWPDGLKTLSDSEKNSLTAAVLRGLVEVAERMAAQSFTRTDAHEIRLNNILVDCGDPSTRDAVFAATRGQRLASRIIASRGRAHHQFFVPDPKKKRVLQNGFLDIWKGLGAVVVHDACVWRERVQRALMLPPGAVGSLDLYGSGATRHRELSVQLCSEKLLEKMTGQSGEMFRWVRIPGTRNHFLDCAVGCMVAATLEGLRYGNEAEGIVKRELPQGGGQRKRERGGFSAIEN